MTTGGDGDLKEWCQKNQVLCALVIILVIYLVWHFFLRKEKLQPFYLDQIAMQSSNPTVVKFLGRERDPLGMSLRDYYLENDMNANNTVAPRYNDDMAFANHTSYLQMPRWWRPSQGYKPRPLAALVGQKDNVTSSDDLSTVSVDGGADDAEIVTERALERMNQKNKSGRERFLH